jgi:hypothetical protein
MTPDQRLALLACTIILEAVKKRIADNERKIADNEKWIADNERKIADNEREMEEIKKQMAEEELKCQSSRENPLNRGP